MTTEERAKQIVEAIKNEKGTDPAEIFRHMARKDFVRMHGPEHHVLDGAAILTAYRNAGGAIDLEAALQSILQEGLRMPGAMCGLWGVCGAVTSIGAALSIIDGTGPLSADGTWGNHMQFTSAALSELGKVNGPRCCKRDAMISFKNGIEYVNEHYNVKLEYEQQEGEFSSENQQCIREKCPFYPNKEN